MASITEACPQPFDIEPTCYSFNPETALKHARNILQITFPEKSAVEIEAMIQPAVGFVIPSTLYPDKYLYGLRSSDSKEFPGAWGLPSTSVSIDDFKNLVTKDEVINPQVAEAVITKMLRSKGQITKSPLIPDKFIGWTGRLRGPGNGFARDYYLILADLKMMPVDSDGVSESTPRYTEFAWLSPQEHMVMVENTPSKACGACSALVYDYSRSKHTT